MLSSFSSSRAPRNIQASSATKLDETYNLRGLNFTDPDEIMPQGDSPYTTNSRMFARNDGESRVANRTRKGASHFSTPVGATLNVQNVGTSTGVVTISPTQAVAIPIQFSSPGSFARLDTEIVKTGFASGPVRVEFWTNAGGFPGTLLAETSIADSAITTSATYITSRFIAAPAVVASTTYWLVYYVQDNGIASYNLTKTAVGVANSLTTTVGTTSWTPVAQSIRYKTYLATTGGIKGYTVRYPSDITLAKVMFAAGTTLYSVARSNGTPVVVDSTLDANATKYRFDQVSDSTLWANGYNVPKQWDGTTVSAIPNVPSEMLAADNILAWNNRVFLYKGNRVVFSELGDRTVWPSVNFFYIPNTSANSADKIVGWRVFNSNLTFWTAKTKYLAIGTNISNFTYKEAVGTKGGVSDEAIAIDQSYAYFMSADKQIYRYNGVSDELLSYAVESELRAITNPQNVRLHLHNNQLRVYYAKNGDPYNNRMLLLDLDMSIPSKGDWRWFMDTNRYVQGSTNMFLDTDNALIELSSLVGAAYYGETSNNDLGAPIDYRFWTNYKNYGSSTTRKRIKRFRPIIRTELADYTLLVGKDMDFQNNPDMRAYSVTSGGAKFGAFIWGDGTKWGGNKQVMNPSAMSGRGNFIQYRFERKGVDTPVELYGFASLLKIGQSK